MNDIIGRNVKRFREMRGISVSELAKMAGYASHSPISSLELGKVGISSKKLKIIADLLEVTVDELTTDESVLENKENLNEKEKLEQLNKILQERIRKVTEVGKEIAEVIKGIK